MNVEAFPLQWPVGWQRTPAEDRQRSRFKTTFGYARDGVVRELGRMDVSRYDIVISSMVPLRKDGLPYATRMKYDDPGVAVYFVLNGEQKCIPCDRWTTVEDNLRAIEKTIDALRGIERWTGGHIVKASFMGFAVLPESIAEGWWTVFGVDKTAPRDEVVSAYRHVMKRVHPDRGGSVEEFHRVQEAYDAALRDRR